jgi:uridine kinase
MVDMLEKIIKRDGSVVPFDRRKISFAILQAAVAVGGRDKRTAEVVTDDVIRLLHQRAYRGTYPTVEEVQDLVEKCLIEHGHAKTAKAYILYRYEHTLKRAGKRNLTYSSENVPYKKLWQALSWAVDHECVSTSQLHNYVLGNRFRELVKHSENFYRFEIETAANEIEKRLQDLKIVIIAGPSASGKTTTTLKIQEIFRKKGIRFVPLVVDNYFFDLTQHPRDIVGDYDFETPQALDLGMINAHLKDLIAGKEIQVPFYNFKKGKRDGFSGTLSLGENEILLIDSLHGMYEEMTAGVPEEQKCSLYIETLSQIKDERGRYIRWPDIRMMRRMVRDTHFRNYNPLETIAHWRYVRRSELRYIISKLESAHIIVNSYLAYELPVLKTYLKDFFPGFVEKLKGVPEYEDARERAVRVSGLLEQIPGWYNDGCIPGDSLLREFIGGSIYTY